MLNIATRQPGFAVDGRSVRRSFFGQNQEIGGVSSPGGLDFAAFVESFAAVLADCFQTREAWFGISGGSLADQALIEQRRYTIERIEPQVFLCVADRLNRFEGASSHKDRKPAEELLLGRRQQVVTPVNRAPQGALPLGEVMSPAGQQFQPAGDSGQKAGGSQNPDARRRQLDRQRQTVQSP